MLLLLPGCWICLCVFPFFLITLIFTTHSCRLGREVVSSGSAADTRLVPWLLVSKGLLLPGVELCRHCLQLTRRLLG